MSVSWKSGLFDIFLIFILLCDILFSIDSIHVAKSWISGFLGMFHGTKLYYEK